MSLQISKTKGTWIKERFTPYEVHSHRLKKIYLKKKTKFQNLVLADTYSFGKCLILDNEVQSAYKDEFIYHECLVHPSMILHPNPKYVLILGGGEGATLREVVKYKSLKKVVMVDIDVEVVKFCKKYLKEWHQGAFDNPKTHLIFDDARKYVEQTDLEFDIIISDLPDPVEKGPARLLYTKEFYTAIKKRLKKNGIFSMQAGSLSLPQFSFHRVIYWTVRSVFKNIFPYYEFVGSFDVPWAFIFASNMYNPKNFNINKVEKVLKQRNIKNLKFYNGETHHKIFVIPPYLKSLYNKQKRINKDNFPISFFK